MARPSPIDRSWSPLGDARLDDLERLRNLGFGRARKPEVLQATGDHGFDANAIAGANTEHRRHTLVALLIEDL